MTFGPQTRDIGTPLVLAALYLAIWASLSPWPLGFDQVLTLSLAPPLIWLSVIDLRRFEIPDTATLTFAVLSGVLVILTHPDRIVSHVMAGLTVLIVFWLLGGVYFRLRRQEGLGIGDAKLFGASVLLLGPEKLPELFILASLGGIVGQGVSALKGNGVVSGIAFGPFIALAAFGLSMIDPMFWQE